MAQDNDAGDVIDAREYTVKELREWADGVDDQHTLNAMYRSELDTKQRKTALEALRRRGVELEDDADGADADGPETVLVANTRVGSVAGHQFDSPHEVVEMDRTPRVEEAINRGDLRVQHE